MYGAFWLFLLSKLHKVFCPDADNDPILLGGITFSLANGADFAASRAVAAFTMSLTFVWFPVLDGV